MNQFHCPGERKVYRSGGRKVGQEGGRERERERERGGKEGEGGREGGRKGERERERGKEGEGGREGGTEGEKVHCVTFMDTCRVIDMFRQVVDRRLINLNGPILQPWYKS